MQIKYIKPFIGACSNALKVMADTDIIAQKPYIYDANTNTNSIFVSGIIGFAGDSLGVVMISMTEAVAKKMTYQMTHVDINNISDELLYDVVGELANIIAGNAKKGFEDIKIVISLPTIVIGDNHKVGWLPTVPVICIPFSSSLGSIYLYVSMKEIL